MALVVSSKPHGRIVSIDASDALALPGVQDFLSSKDVPGSNIYRLTHDEMVFADSQVLISLTRIGIRHMDCHY